MLEITLSEAQTQTLSIAHRCRLTLDLSVSQALCQEVPQASQEVAQAIEKQLKTIWGTFVPLLSENNWIQGAQANGIEITLSVILVTNPEIQALNSDFRQKNQATDVLTFSLLEEGAPPMALNTMPELPLGEIYISIPWALEALKTPEKAENSCTLQLGNSQNPLVLYVLERLVHGFLHLLGVHHDTEADYNKVLAIQKQVLHAL